MSKLGPVGFTQRGFEIIYFLDEYKTGCSLQASSLAIYEDPGSSAVWLGSLDDRMHLGREQVAALIYHLQNWLDENSFERDGES
jgi:hypothetical protein